MDVELKLGFLRCGEEMTAKLKHLEGAVNHESETTCVVVTTSYVDFALRTLLRETLCKGDTSESLLHTQKGALGSLHAASGVAYAIGIISSGCKTNIDRIGSIRNRFAHEIDGMSFQDVKVVEMCHQLKGPLVPKAANVDPSSDEPGSGWAHDPRSRFTIVAFQMVHALLLDAIGAKRFETKKDYWDR